MQLTIKDQLPNFGLKAMLYHVDRCLSSQARVSPPLDLELKTLKGLLEKLLSDRHDVLNDMLHNGLPGILFADVNSIASHAYHSPMLPHFPHIWIMYEGVVHGPTTKIPLLH